MSSIYKKYNVIYTDPPWTYNNKSVKFDAEQENLAVCEEYSLMTMDELFQMPIKDISQDNALMFMWVVNPLLQEGMDLLKAWGYKYKTMWTWEKNTGTGFWFRGVTEHILLGVRGNVKCFRSGIPNLHKCKSGKHSQKPVYFRQTISKIVHEQFEKGLFPEPKKLEIFARGRDTLWPELEYEGWDVFGNQIDGSIDIPKFIF